MELSYWTQQWTPVIWCPKHEICTRKKFEIFHQKKQLELQLLKSSSAHGVLKVHKLKEQFCCIKDTFFGRQVLVKRALKSQLKAIRNSTANTCEKVRTVPSIFTIGSPRCASLIEAKQRALKKLAITTSKEKKIRKLTRQNSDLKSSQESYASQHNTRRRSMIIFNLWTCCCHIPNQQKWIESSGITSVWTENWLCANKQTNSNGRSQKISIMYLQEKVSTKHYAQYRISETMQICHTIDSRLTATLP